MSRTHIIRLAVFSLAVVGCDASTELEEIGSTEQAITDVNHSEVERQSIGNCWLYAQASWVESLMKSATQEGEEFDVSQSYWTYWHWFDQVAGYYRPSEIQTGGSQYVSHQLVRERGIMAEKDFVPEDGDNEMSFRQSSALNRINQALKNNEFGDGNGKKVREIFDDAWGLSAEVRLQLDQAFGEDGELTLRQGADVSGTNIRDPATISVRYTQRVKISSNPPKYRIRVQNKMLLDAVASWDEAYYPYSDKDRRAFLKRVQLALHHSQPVVITWDVDFNALGDGGIFSLENLQGAGRPGRQGGHMTVLEDYAAVIKDGDEEIVLEAGKTLRPDDPEGWARLQAALRDDAKIMLLRVKNSWGKDREDRSFVPGMPGYHDLWMSYLNGPIAFCPDETNPTNESCTGETNPLNGVMLPPGY